MRVAAVVVTWNGEHWIERCLRSLAAQSPRPFAVIVDNASSDRTLPTVERVQADSAVAALDVRVVRLGSNIGFPAGVNRGLAVIDQLATRMDFILLVNQDTVLEPLCLTALCDAALSNPRAGALGAKTIYDSRGTIQHAGGFLTQPRLLGLHYGHHEADVEGAHDQVREVEFVTAACVMLRSCAIAEVGPLNEVFSPGYYEDVELCDRLRSAGWSVHFVPGARAVHAESSSFSDRDSRLRLAHRNRLLYLLPRLADPSFREAFLSAEVGFLESEAHFDELRAIRSAALELLSRLDDVIIRRLAGRRQIPGFAEMTAAVLDQIFRVSVGELMARASVRGRAAGAGQ
jgi:GT2 family glycosyltransferase